MVRNLNPHHFSAKNLSPGSLRYATGVHQWNISVSTIISTMTVPVNLPRRVPQNVLELSFLTNSVPPSGDFLLACCLSTYHANGKVVIIHPLPAFI